MNHNRTVLTLAWDYLTAEQADAIVLFLEEQGGDRAFLYTPPGRSEPMRFTCAEWEEGFNVRTLRSVKATFRQDFNLADPS
jgi:phage-related protein